MNRKFKLFGMKRAQNKSFCNHSTAISWYGVLDLLAFNANKFCVFAAIHEARKTKKNSCKEEKKESPDNCDTSNFFPHDLSCIGSTELAWASIIVSISSIDRDDGWALLLWLVHLLLHHWLHHWLLILLSVHWLHWLSVHLLELYLSIDY